MNTKYAISLTQLPSVLCFYFLFNSSGLCIEGCYAACVGSWLLTFQEVTLPSFLEDAADRLSRNASK
jgi:hypothetical protein